MASTFTGAVSALLLLLLLLPFLSPFVSATGILLPLYTHPSSSAWDPALAAISASSTSTPWLVVINPSTGPGGTGLPGNGDGDYIAALSRLNTHPNVQTLGYVRTAHGGAAADELRANVTSWASWGSGQDDVGVDGIFFDETSADPAGFEHLSAAVAAARAAFGSKKMVAACNFGVAAPAEYYSICDVVVVFESFLNNAGADADADAPAYMGRATFEANLPRGDGGGGGYAARAAALVHHFAGAAADGRDADIGLLGGFVREAVSAGLGWVYFCSGDYGSITTGPATIEALAAAF